MKIWVITYGDGFDTCDVFVEAYDTEQEADRRATELQAKETSKYGGYGVNEYDLNSKEYNG